MNIGKTGIILIAALGVIAASASYAQGRGGGQGRGQAPSQMRDSARQDSMRRDMEDMRARSEQRRLEADARRVEAEAKRAEAEANRQNGEDARAVHDRSAEMRAAHAPNEHAAPEAFLAEENALNAELREQRKDLRAENRGDRGPEDDGGDDD